MARTFSFSRHNPVLLALLTAALHAPIMEAAVALPKYAQKENKKCSYCHIKPLGGGKRNAAGKWYQAHGLSFAGYAKVKTGTTKKPAARKAARKPPKQGKAK